MQVIQLLFVKKEEDKLIAQELSYMLISQPIKVEHNSSCSSFKEYGECMNIIDNLKKRLHSI